MSTERLTQRGFTLVESIVFIVVISIAVVGLLGVMNLANTHSVDPMRRKQALMIAEALLEEVQLAPITYCDPTSANWDKASGQAGCETGKAEGWGVEAGETRPYNNLSDYVTTSGSFQSAFGGTGELLGQSLNPLPTGFAASLSIQGVDLNGLGVSAGADNKAFLITVKVTYDKDSIVLSGYRTRYAPVNE
jgi:MSHA pilin protein MshD